MTEPDQTPDRARSIFESLRSGAAFANPDTAPGEPESGQPEDGRRDSDDAATDRLASAGAGAQADAPSGDVEEPAPPLGLPDDVSDPAPHRTAELQSEAPSPGPASEGTGPDPAPVAGTEAGRPLPPPGLPQVSAPADSHAPTQPGTPQTHQGATGVNTAMPAAPTAPGASPFAEQISTELRDVPPIEAVESSVPGRHPGSTNHRLPRCLAVANQKGGVGKTTTTVNLGAALAELGYRVLVVDLDPQGNATTGLGVNARNLESSVYDAILHDVPIEDTIEPTSLRNLFIVPATIDLAGAEIELVPVFSRELRLRRALETVEADFDFVLIDCPPSLGLLTVNALAAAGEVLVPIQCEYYALEGLGQLLRNVNLVQSNLNNRLEVSTIVLTMYDARTKLADQVAHEVREHFGARVCRNVVPRTVRLSEAPSFGQPVITFDSSSRGAIAYRELAKEVSGGAPQRVR